MEAIISLPEIHGEKIKRGRLESLPRLRNNSEVL
jgi:hypothetical protein